MSPRCCNAKNRTSQEGVVRLGQVLRRSTGHQGGRTKEEGEGAPPPAAAPHDCLESDNIQSEWTDNSRRMLPRRLYACIIFRIIVIFLHISHNTEDKMVFVARVAQQIIAGLGPNPAQYLFKLLVGASTGPV